MDEVNKLFSKSVNIIREAKARYNNLALMWAGGKDSTLMLYITKEAFFGKVPMPVVFVDTTFQFRETYDFIRIIKNLWGFNIIRVQNRDALMKGTSPFSTPTLECCI